MMRQPRIAHFAWSMCAVTLLVALAAQCFASEALLLRQDDARVMKFEKMKRVWVTDPAIIDVVVSGYHELLVYSKSPGRTKLYVWDSRGRHEYAVEVKRVPIAGSVARELANVLGPRLRYIVVDDKTILIEGEVATQAEKERVSKVAEAKADGLKIVDAVTIRGMGLSPAARYQQAFTQLFPNDLEYTQIDDNSLVIEGTVQTVSECTRMDQIIAAASNLKIVNLVRCAEGGWDPQSSRIASLRKSLGDQYEYVALDANTIAIKGIAINETEKQRVDQLVAAISGDTKVVNMLQMADMNRTAAELVIAAVKPMFAQPLIYREMDANTLVIEGQLDTAAEKERLDKILAGSPSSVKVINLVTVPAGRDPWSNSAAGQIASRINDVLGAEYNAVALDEKTLLVDGLAPSEDALKQTTDAITKLAGDLTIINMVSTRQMAENIPASERMVKNLANILPAGVQAIAIDEKTILFEGIVPTTIEKERTDKIAEMAGKTANLNVMSLVMTQMQSKSPATRRIEQLRKVLGDTYNYIAWDEETVLVEGRVANQNELERARKILSAANEDWKVGDLITYGVAPTVQIAGADGDAVINEISTAIGANFSVRRIHGDKILVEGQADDAADLERVNKILDIFKENAQIIPLVTVARISPSLLIDTSEALRDALGGAYQVRTLQGKAVVVEGVALTKNEQERTRQVLTTLGGDVPVVDLITVADPTKKQIVVHTKVMQISRGLGEDLGVSWGQLMSTEDDKVAFGGQPILLNVEGGFGTLSSVVANFIAENQNDDSQILAEPNLVVNEDESAEMLVGGEVPIPVPQIGTGGNTVTIEYKKYGVLLKIKPTVVDGGNSVKLDIETEVSSVDFSTQISVGGIAVPGFRTRRAQTILTLPDGSTLMLAGLLSHEQTKVVNEIPLLSKLPIIGQLFRNRSFQESSSELVILVSPEILKNKQP